jgi:hypothetical protein
MEVASDTITQPAAVIKRSFAKPAGTSAANKKKVVVADDPPTPAAAPPVAPKKPSAKRAKAGADAPLAAAAAAPDSAAKSSKASRAPKKAKNDAAAPAPVDATPAAAAAPAPVAAPKRKAAVKKTKAADDGADTAAPAAAAAADATAAAAATSTPTAPHASTRVRVDDKVAAFKRAFLHPYGTLVSSLDKEEACRSAQVAFHNLSPTMIQRFLALLLAHQKELPKAARASTSRKDVMGTLDKYRKRLEEKRTAEDFAALQGKWLSHYKVDGFIPASDLAKEGFEVPLEAAEAYTVYQVALSKGIQPLGLVSERGIKVDKTNKDNKDRIHLVQVEGPREYVGSAMTMWNLPKTRFCCKSKDTVLFPKKARTSAGATAAAASDVDPASA